MENSRKKPGRRNFLIAVGAGSGAAIAAVAAKTVPQKEASAAKKDEERSGYQLSEHIRKYYRSTLV
jgi:precorrin-6B methylase 2